MTKLMLWTCFLLMTTIQVITAGSLRRLGDDVRSGGPYRPMCYPEIGFDYEGHDFKNVPNKQADDCCSECIKVDGCKAWSWSNYSNGTCWLKNDRGRILVNANVQSALLCDGPHTVCQVADDVDFVGNDIANVTSKSVDGCCDLCHNHLGCRAYSWSNFNGGTCWLKSTKGVAIVKKGVQSAEAYPTSAYEPVCALQDGVDFVGYDIGSAPSAEPTGCCSICLNTRGCRAFAWTNQSKGRCYLKSFSGQTIQKAGVVSSVVFPNPSFTCDVETGYDYVGNDLASVLSPIADFCCTICAEYPGCNAYTYSNYEGGTCWLKRNKGGRVQNKNTLSGSPSKN